MSISKLLFGEIALKKNLVTKEQVEECLDIQKKLKDMGITKTLGAVMHDKKFLSMVEIKEILREMTGTKDWNAIEGYEILGKLGKGGMGAVYKARHQKLNKVVALKVLPPELAADQEYLDRFLREARAAAKLNHVNIVQALDVGESYGYHYFVMEYAEGKTVKDLIEEKGTLEEAQGLDIIEQISSALGHAAKHDLVHRDIKPSNIIVSSDGVAKLLDLGLAKSISEDQTITQTGVIMGTPFYLSPEQARSEPLDPRSDLYSLGVTMFHMLTGQVPFNGNSAATILYKHIFQDPPKPRSLNPKVSPQVSELVVRMMAKNKEDRPASPDTLIEEIEAVRSAVGIVLRSKGRAAPGARKSAPTIQSPAGGGEAEGLDNTLASSGAGGAAATAEGPAAVGGEAVTMDEPALELEVSGPQTPATPTAETEAISAPDKRKRKLAEAAVAAAAKRAGPSKRKAPTLGVRGLVAAGSGACVFAVIAVVLHNVFSVQALGFGAITDVAAAVVADEPSSPVIAEALRRVEALRVAKRMREAIDSLNALAVEPAHEGLRLRAADEVAIDRTRAKIVTEAKLQAEVLNKQYDEVNNQGGETEAIVNSIRALDLPAVLQLLETERARLEAEKGE